MNFYFRSEGAASFSSTLDMLYFYYCLLSLNQLPLEPNTIPALMMVRLIEIDLAYLIQSQGLLVALALHQMGVSSV